MILLSRENSTNGTGCPRKLVPARVALRVEGSACASFCPSWQRPRFGSYTA
jgi:hypothetical protein